MFLDAFPGETGSTRPASRPRGRQVHAGPEGRGRWPRPATPPRPTWRRSNYPDGDAWCYVLVIFVTMVYGPIAAWLVELFPTRIRYTSMSLPYHIGNGWFGGFLPTMAFAIVAATGDIYYGLWYPIVIAVSDARDRPVLRSRDQGPRDPPRGVIPSSSRAATPAQNPAEWREKNRVRGRDLLKLPLDHTDCRRSRDDPRRA